MPCHFQQVRWSIANTLLWIGKQNEAFLDPHQLLKNRTYTMHVGTWGTVRQLEASVLLQPFDLDDNTLEEESHSRTMTRPWRAFFVHCSFWCILPSASAKLTEIWTMLSSRLPQDALPKNCYCYLLLFYDTSSSRRQLYTCGCSIRW